MSGVLRRIAAAALAAAAGARGQVGGAGWHSDVDPVRIARSELDIREAGLFRLSDGGLVLRVRCAASPPGPSVRVLLDVAPPGGGRAQWMLEGDVVFRRPPGAKGWTWDEVGGAASAASAFGIRSILLPPDLPAGPVQWAVETLDSEWNVVDRLPATGMIESLPGRIPEIGAESTPPADQRISIEGHPALAARWEAIADGGAWEDVSAPAPWPALALPDGLAAPVAFSIRRPDGTNVVLTPRVSARDGERQRWRGGEDGLDWTLVAAPGPDGATWFGVEFRSAELRRFEFVADVRLPPAAWKVALPDGRAAPLEPAVWANPLLSAPSPIGAGGRTALWPVATAVSPASCVTLALDEAEPHPCRFEGQREPPSLSAVLPVAVTPATGRFPGRACVALQMRASPPWRNGFRSAVAWWQKMRSPAALAEVPRQWVAAASEGAAARAVVGDPVAVESMRGGERQVAGMTWRFVRLRPWVCDLPRPRRWPAEAAAALRLLRFHAMTGGAASWYAQAALLGAVRRSDDSIEVEAVSLPSGEFIRVPVSADPDFLTTAGAPWNRAMLEWACALHFQEAAEVRAFLFDAIEATAGLDANRAALAACDRAAVWGGDAQQPAVARQSDAREFLDAFRRLPGKEGAIPAIALMNPFESHAALAPSADMVLFDDELAGDVLAPRIVRYRLLAGARPCLRVLTGDFEWIEPARIETALAESAAMGFVPVLSRDTSGQSYWSNSAWALRDGPALRTWAPLAARLASAGWRAEPSVRAGGGLVIAEEFGEGPLRHVALWNRGAAPADAEVAWPADGEAAWFWARPLDAACAPAEIAGGAARARCRIRPGEVAVIDLVEASAFDRELAWLDGWPGARQQGPAAAANLRALRTEAAGGARLDIEAPAPWILGADNAVRARVRNLAAEPLVVADARWLGMVGGPALLPQPRILGGGEAAAFEFRLKDRPPGAGDWIVLQWTFERGDRTWITQRRLRAEWVEPVEIGPVSTRSAIDGVVEIDVRLRNHSDARRTLTLVWEGDFPGGRTETVLEPLEVRALALPVPAGPGQSGRMAVRVLENGRERHRADVRLRSPGRDAASP